MTTTAARLALVLFALLLLGACNRTPDDLGRTDTACPIGSEPARELALYFGRSIPGGGEVTEAEWRAFLDREVTPRFPEGLTVHEARGQWRGEGRGEDGNAIEREASKVLSILVFDAAAAEAKVDALIDAYKTQFRQESVLRVARPVCARF